MKKTIRIIQIVVLIFLLICFGINMYYLARGEAPPKSLMVTFLVMCFLLAILGLIYPIKLKKISTTLIFIFLIAVILLASLIYIFIISKKFFNI